MTTTVYAGRFDFEDGGTYCGGWEDGKAHGHGVCTGPKSMGEFSGMWQFGYEVSGVYIWPSGNCYQGQWMSGKRHGLGVEKKQRWIYKGEWSQGFKGRYGIRISENSGAKYEGTWANGLQDGYGSETYADCGTYFGQMSQGMRNGYGIRKSVSYGVASRYRSKDVKDSLTSLRSEDGDEKVQRERDRRFDENRGGFVLRAKSDIGEDLSAVANAAANVYMPNSGGNIMTNALNGLLRRRRNSLNHSQDRRVSLRKTIISKLKKQKSVGDIDEVNVMTSSSGGAHASTNHNNHHHSNHLNTNNTNSHSNTLNANVNTSSSGRTNKKSSFRSTSSNNSVDSRTSNRTAPPGLGLANTYGTMTSSHNQQDDGEHSFISQDEITDVNCIEVYMGEWKQDKRTGFGIAERSDGLKYEGEWFNNKKNGYGVTTFKDGSKEEGKYRNNVLCTDKKKATKLLMLRSNKIRQKIDAAVNAALKAAQIAQQRADIALARAVNARTKANAAEMAAKQARGDSDYARIRAKEVAPDFVQPGESKRIPEIILDIDRMNGYGGGGGYDMLLGLDPYRKQPPINIQMKPPDPSAYGLVDPYMMNNWQSHSSTPPPPSLIPRHQTPVRSFNNNSSNAASSFYEQQQQNILHQQHSMDFPATNNNFLSSNQLTMMQNQHPSMDSSSTAGQKFNNDNLPGGMMNQYDAQQLQQLQQQQQPSMQQMSNFMQQQQQAAMNNSKLMQQQTYSFDESATNYYGGGGDAVVGAGMPPQQQPYRMNMLQQAQSHSFNMDMLMNNPGNSQQLEQLMQQQQQQFYQNPSPFQRNSKRLTLRRTQRVVDASTDEINNVDFHNLTPQQQQQLIMLRNQQQQQQQHQHHPHHPHHHHHQQQQLLEQQQQQGASATSPHQHRPQLVAGKSMDAGTGHHRIDPEFMKLPIQLPRRKSLPSIVKMRSSYKEDETAHSSSELNNKNQETFIIENGIRKRVTEKSNSAMMNQQNKLSGAGGGENSQQQQMMMKNQMEMGVGAAEDMMAATGSGLRRRYEYDDDEMPQLPRKIVIESITTLNGADSGATGSKRVSMPSIPAYYSPKFANKVMSREEANRLSSLRREEIRKNLEMEGNKMLRLKTLLKNDSISMFFKNTADCSIQTDEDDYISWIKDVFLRNRLFLFIILFNVSLAIWFLQMLK